MNVSVLDSHPVESGKSCILISPYHEPDISEKFISMRERGIGVFWVIPYFGHDEVSVASDDDIIKWEVTV